jgi:3-oxoacyl-[acyl-carrier protein] reductase
MGERLAGKHALVTGSTGGLGAAIARRFAAEGARVFVHGRRQDLAEALATELGTEYGLADVTRSVEVDALFQRCLERFGRLDILVNSAGSGGDEESAFFKQSVGRYLHQRGERLRGLPISQHIDATVELGDEAWSATIDGYLTSTFYCTRAALRVMTAQGSGSILNVASLAGTRGVGYAAHYSAAKAGVIGLTRAVAQEMGSRGIRVNAIAPGFLSTSRFGPRSPVFVGAVSAESALQRLGTAEEIAAAAVYLSSDEASYTTGEVLELKGGAAP